MTAEYCSKKCGVITVRTSTQMSPQNPMFSFIYGAGGNRYSQTRSEGQRSLMLADEITRLDTQKCIALIGGHKPLLLCKVKPEEIPGFTELQPTRIMDYVPLWYALDQQRSNSPKPGRCLRNFPRRRQCRRLLPYPNGLGRNNRCSRC